MKRLSVPLTDKQHHAIKIRATVKGLPMTRIVRLFLAAWLRGELEVPPSGPLGGEERRADNK